MNRVNNYVKVWPASGKLIPVKNERKSLRNGKKLLKKLSICKCSLQFAIHYGLNVGMKYLLGDDKNRINMCTVK